MIADGAIVSFKLALQFMFGSLLYLSVEMFVVTVKKRPIHVIGNDPTELVRLMVPLNQSGKNERRLHSSNPVGMIKNSTTNDVPTTQGICTLSSWHDQMTQATNQVEIYLIFIHVLQSWKQKSESSQKMFLNEKFHVRLFTFFSLLYEASITCHLFSYHLSLRVVHLEQLNLLVSS